MAREKGWNLLCKFFDNMGPIPASHAPERRGRASASAAAASPRPTTFRRNTTRPTTTFPTRSWGSSRGRRRTTCGGASRTGTRATTASRILSRAYRLERGTGWQIDPGILHAPGSLLTYEPQVNSDVFAMFQSEVEGRIIAWEPAGQGRAAGQATSDLDYIIGMLDWDANVNPRFGESNRCFPKPGEAVRGDRGRRLSRAVGHATAPAGIRRRS